MSDHAKRCTASPPCTTKAQMRAAHGTPEQFRMACFRAIGECSVAEYEDAATNYEREYEEAPE